MNKIKRNNIAFLLVAVLLMGGLQACSENENDTESVRYVNPGHYLLTFDISATNGDGMDYNNVSARAMDPGTELFTAEYDRPYIYFHAGDVHIKYELEDGIPDCMTQNCKGIQFDLTVNEDQSYTINKDGQEYNIPEGTQGYFSSWPTDEWTGTFLTDEPKDYPLEEQGETIHMLDQHGENNTEIFRSKENFSVADLTDLGEIIMTRECAAFRAFITFVDLDEPNYSSETMTLYTNKKENWTIPEDRFYIKCYMGPMFCSTYSIKNQAGIGNSYYVTNYNKYVQFQNGSHSENTTANTVITYTGFGMHSAESYFLIAPFFDETKYPEKNSYTIDIFVKVLPEGETADEEFLTSNEGAFYFTATISSNPPEMGKTHWANLIYDEDQLMEIAEMIAAEGTNAVGVRSVTTRNGLRWVDIKPAKVITK